MNNPTLNTVTYKLFIFKHIRKDKRPTRHLMSSQIGRRNSSFEIVYSLHVMESIVPAQVCTCVGHLQFLHNSPVAIMGNVCATTRMTDCSLPGSLNFSYKHSVFFYIIIIIIILLIIIMIKINFEIYIQQRATGSRVEQIRHCQ
jgi:hypothetical protein